MQAVLGAGQLSRRAWQADICQLGMDQRKVNMLAREYCDDIKRKLKPVILSHAMLPGLKQARPDSCAGAAAVDGPGAWPEHL